MFGRLRYAMSIIAAYNEAWENGDVEALSQIIHDDFVFNPHVGGITMGKSDLLGFAGSEGGPKSRTIESYSRMTRLESHTQSYTSQMDPLLKQLCPS